MTDECRPAAGAADGSLHWLRGRNMDVCDTAKWHSNPSEFWTQDGEEYWPDQMARHYIYHLPASPDDATERARLEQENARLREALEIAREGLLIVSGQRQCVDNLLSHEAIALEALRLIEEPGNAR